MGWTISVLPWLKHPGPLWLNEVSLKCLQQYDVVSLAIQERQKPPKPKPSDSNPKALKL